MFFYIARSFYFEFLLPGGHQFLPFVIETGGAWGLDACNLFRQCKSRLADASGGACGGPPGRRGGVTLEQLP